MRYHIYKETEGYRGQAYSGKSSNGLPLEFDFIVTALLARSKLIFADNSIKWLIRDRMFSRDVDTVND